MTSARRPQKLTLPAALSWPVVLVLFFLTNAVFLVSLDRAMSAYRLRERGRTIDAMITHVWSASWIPSASDHFIGYAYVDEHGVEHRGSARINEAGLTHFEVGEMVPVVIDPEAPGESMLENDVYIAWIERASRSLPGVALMGILAVISAWLLIVRIRRSWRTLDG